MLYDNPAWKIKYNYSQVSSVVKDFRICPKSNMVGKTKPKITYSTAEINTQFVFRDSINYFYKVISYLWPFIFSMKKSWNIIWILK